MGNLDMDPQEWLEELFEYEYCDECGGDAPDHDAVGFVGNWFARCKPDAVDRRGQDGPDNDDWISAAYEAGCDTRQPVTTQDLILEKLRFER